MEVSATTEVSNRSKKGIFSNFKEKHPRATKIVKIGVYSVSALAAAAGVCGGGYIIFRNPEIGEDSWRSHFTKEGFRKVAYNTAERANIQTLKDFLFRKGHPWMPAYVCPICGKFHIGHKH